MNNDSSYLRAVTFANKFRACGFASEVWGIAFGDDRIAYVIIPELPSTFRFLQNGDMQDVTELNLNIAGLGYTLLDA